jgi:hypothetical protein
MDPSDREIGAKGSGTGEPDREGTRLGHPAPRTRVERPQEMADRFRESFVGRLGKGKPASGMHFPMVHAVEAVDGERAEGPGDDTEQSLHLDHLPLPEQ